jgi:hypothetical protein
LDYQRDDCEVFAEGSGVRVVAGHEAAGCVLLVCF